MKLPVAPNGSKIALVLVFTVVMGVMLTAHVGGLNGPSYWKWPYRSLPHLRVVLLFAAAAIPSLLGFILYRAKGWVHASLSLTMITMLLVMVTSAWLLQHPQVEGLKRVSRLVRSPIVTSYFTDARSYTEFGDWMKTYPERTKNFHVHSINKGPGLVLYYVVLQKNFEENAALIGGLLIGVLGCLALPCIFYFLRTLGLEQEAALRGTFFYALCPAPLLFFPQFDQAYPILSCALLGFWIKALDTDDARYAAGFGVVLALILFTSYSLISLGLFVLCYAFYFVKRNDLAASAWWSLGRQVLCGLGTLFAIYLLLYLFFGFNIIDTFLSAVENNANQGMDASRPYGVSRFWVVYDLFLGTAWIPACLIAFLLRDAGLTRHQKWILAICLVQIVGVTLSGMVRAETARVWIFLMPLLMVPIAMELEKYKGREVLVVFACVFSMTTIVFKNMGFL